jgi:beta-fructofuranosidase
MLRLAREWVWDFWFADDGRLFHLYYLQAPRALGDPGRRHRHARIGHATSRDLVDWSPAGEVLGPGAAPAFDDMATWTGSVLRAPDGTWCMFYTGSSAVEGGYVQRIGLATSADLYSWRKHPASPVLAADPRWYERSGGGVLDETWRDPWVFADPGGDGWHMLLTARAGEDGQSGQGGQDGQDGQGAHGDRGVIGHARSADLVRWEACPPLSQAGAGFWHLEVPQVEVVDGRPVLLFSGPRYVADGVGVTWWVRCESVLGPFDVARSVPVAGAELYSGRLIRDRGGQWVLLAFRNLGPDGGFVGEITDPMPVSWDRVGEALVVQTLPG